jgi:hypothetical protein
VSPPDWVILGAPRAGTTTLASWLGRHPQGFVPPAKEVSYFDLHYDRGQAWYDAQFAAAASGQLLGDATPAYLYSDKALDRLAADAPAARLIVILREPAERVWSHWVYNRALGLEPRSFSKAIAAERRDPTNAPWRLPIGYLGCSRYARRLESVAGRFDREQLLVLFFDDLRSDPAAVFGSACRHLGIEGLPPPDTSSHNAGRLPRSALLQHALMRMHAGSWPGGLGPRLARLNTRPGGAPPMPVHVAADLKSEFVDDNRQLVRWLGRDLPPGWTT